jgi:DegV family protein with EDD domain
MLQIVTDGAADLPAAWEAEYDIHILPLRVSFGEETFTQGPGFTHADFYRKVNEKRIIPKTSLPSPGQVAEFYRSFAHPGDIILSLHVSARLSGTFATVQAAARELADQYQIFVFDTGAGSAVQGFMAREARLLDRAGQPITAILQRLEWIRERLIVLFTLDNLEFAYLNGRISALQNLLSSILQIKPIIVLRDGMLEIGDKVRTRHRALDKILDMVRGKLGNRLINIAVVHAADPHMAQEMLDKVRKALLIREDMVTDLAIPVAANLGPGTIGIVAYPVEEDC